MSEECGINNHRSLQLSTLPLNHQSLQSIAKLSNGKVHRLDGNFGGGFLGRYSLGARATHHKLDIDHQRRYPISHPLRGVTNHTHFDLTLLFLIPTAWAYLPGTYAIAVMRDGGKTTVGITPELHAARFSANFGQVAGFKFNLTDVRPETRIEVQFIKLLPKPTGQVHWSQERDTDTLILDKQEFDLDAQSGGSSNFEQSITNSRFYHVRMSFVKHLAT